MTSDALLSMPAYDIDAGATARARRRFVAVAFCMLAGFVALGSGWWLMASARFDAERIVTEAETMSNAMEGMLAMGLPVSDFIGFEAASSRILRFDSAVRAVAIVDLTDRVAMVNPPGFTATDMEWHDGERLFADRGGDASFQHSGWLSRLSLPVTGRFGPAGRIDVYYVHALEAEVSRSTAIAGLAAIALLFLGTAVHAMVLANPEVFQSVREMATIYLLVCLIGLAITGATLFGLGARKAIETANAYGESLGSRLGDAIAMGIDPSDLAGLGDVVREYQESNDIISYVALLEGNRIEAAAGLPDASDRWVRPSGTYDAVIEVRPRRLYRPQYRVAIGIPTDVVTRLLWQTGQATLAMLAALSLAGLVLLRWIRVRPGEAPAVAKPPAR